MTVQRILILTGDFVEDYEIIVPFQLLLTIGHKVDVVSPGKKAGDFLATAIHDFEGYQTYTEKRGHNFELNATYSDVKASDYDALVIPGGRAPEHLATDESVLELVRAFTSANKPIAAICHGPQLLLAAEILSGRKVAAYPAIKSQVTAAGAQYQDIEIDGAVTDDKLVTAPAWPAHPAWMSHFLKVLGTKIDP
ncbi:LAME_0G20230g1_1 [Lachancea meyersii CBS 8951]|uniref:LAME_0G20230g1_1 n=1 Tax=Lachancea meyersii CBS 8951 TaxID=1266667 RepID=A0A1G4KCI8_9SACH|nr:LAME_0G20230g1_1 [Lachancea meyersii CBS 8951]